MIGSQAEGIPRFAIYVPGADTWMNASRRIPAGVGFIEHTTQGNDSRGLGANRHHNSPGTFNHLNRSDGWYCYYPDWVRCSHAAGANSRPGVENEGFTGQPLSSRQIDQQGMYLEWRREVYGRDQSFYLADGARIWLDQEPGRTGTYAHNVVAYPPNTSYHHYDKITLAEYASALARSGGGGGGAQPQEDDMYTIYILQAPGVPQGWVLSDGTGYTQIGDPEMQFMRAIRAFGVKSIEYPVKTPITALTIAKKAGMV